MTTSSAINRTIAFKKETSWGVAPGTGSAQYLRRTNTTLQLSKDTYQSNEVTRTQQIFDYRHGGHKVDGNIEGELSPLTYSLFMAAICRRDFTAVSAMTGLSITVAGTGPSYTLTDATATFLTDGVKIGMVVRLSAGSFAAANLNNNLRVTAATETVLTVVPDSGTMTAEGPIASATVSVVGKVTYVPKSGHTNDSFYIEDYHTAITESEQFGGCRVSTVALTLPSTGIATIQNGFMGKKMNPTSGSSYFLTPSDETTTGLIQAVNGALRVGSTDVANVTGATLNITGNLSDARVLGSNYTPDVFVGKVLVTGQFTAYFEDVSLRDLFLNETETSLQLYGKADGSANGDFLNFIMPRIKVGGSGKDDGEKGIIQTVPFVALYNSAGGAGLTTEQTTLLIQDSAA